MADIVVVPTFDRPEYLWVCLEKLSEAAGVQDKEIWVCEDNHGPKDGWVSINMIPTLAYWEKRLPLRYIYREPHTAYGNSYNVLTALADACKAQARYIYLVEDDVMVLPDFFTWHEAVQQQNAVYGPVSCAERYNHSLNFAINGQYVLDESFKDSNAYINKNDVYSSLGVCFPFETLRLFMYMNYPAGGWKSYPFAPGVEQDILIKSWIKKVHLPVIWPYVPRCYHMGWYGYHRNTGMRFNGTLEEKVTALKAAMVDPSRIREMAGAQDIEAYPTNPIEWSGEVYSIAKYR